MKKAYLNLRYTSDKRAKLFEAGLSRLGFTPIHELPSSPTENDIFVTWNRIGAGDNVAKVFESIGAKVLVAENASWGNTFCDQNWYHIARNLHNTVRMFDYHGAERFNALAVELEPFDKEGETIILPQRGIGSKPVAMPSNFLKIAKKEHGGRVRTHPGKREVISLEDDLKNCGKVVTWASGAAIKALIKGIPVTSYYENWIAKQDNTEAGRLEMLQNLAWAQWTYSEIKSGEAFDLLLN